jgi:hypothetical protein
MKQDYEKPELVIYEDLSDVVAAISPSGDITTTGDSSTSGNITIVAH